MPTDLDAVIERVPLHELRPFPDNPRKGNVVELSLMLKSNGQQQPLLVSSDGVILAGNHRWEAMKLLDWPTAKVLRATTPEGEPVHSTDPFAARIVAADNRATDLAEGYDPAKLVQLLTSLPELTGSGYADDDLSELLTALDSLPDAPPINDGWGGGTGGFGDPTPPDDFNEYDETIETAYGCPSCGYEWSGNPRPNGATHLPPKAADDDTDDEAAVSGADDGGHPRFTG